MYKHRDCLYNTHKSHEQIVNCSVIHHWCWEHNRSRTLVKVSFEGRYRRHWINSKNTHSFNIIDSDTVGYCRRRLSRINVHVYALSVLLYISIKYGKLQHEMHCKFQLRHHFYFIWYKIYKNYFCFIYLNLWRNKT